MFKNYIKIALRNLNRNKVYSLINIGGLTVGLACSLLIFLYVQDELSFDKIHENYQNIHRLDSRYKINDSFQANLDFPAGLAPILREETGGVKNAVRYDRKPKAIVVNGTEKIYEEHLSYTEPEFFEMFNFELDAGDKKTALEKPFSIVISQELANKYFFDTNPLGQIFSVDQKEFEVTGVLARPA